MVMCWCSIELGQTRWKYSAGSWINGVGVSSDGSVIAAGALDGTLYILDRNGNLLVKTKTNTLIQQGSVAISRDGKRIIVADEGALYGFDLLGDPELTSTKTQTPTPVLYCHKFTPSHHKNNPASNRFIASRDNYPGDTQHSGSIT